MMHGDFTRGHAPDRRQNLRFRRVLQQQGRVLLDSDLAALVDAADTNLREVAEQTGCKAGSPDLGYLITPGKLLAVFSSLEAVSIASTAPLLARRDYQVKYLDRFPSLYLSANSGSNGRVSITTRYPVSGPTNFYARSSATTNLSVNGVQLVVPAAANLQSCLIELPASDLLEIEVPAGDEVWIGLIESHHPATSKPEFSVAAGHFHRQGLVVSNHKDRYWPYVNFPDVTGFEPADLNPTAGSALVAYLEVWERHITAVEVPALLETALGRGQDTTTRTQALGHVKLMAAGTLTGSQISQAFNNRIESTGRLGISAPGANPNPDPCALPAPGGYQGLDNRLYRFEIHNAGSHQNFLLKWSRDNGSELFSVTDATSSQLTFAVDTPLRAGDLVEILSEKLVLSDQTPASFVGSQFAQPQRAVGILARLLPVVSTSGSSTIAFSLADPVDDSIVLAPLSLADLGDATKPRLKVRRWHGLVTGDPAANPLVVSIEHGIRIEATGDFSSHDYWLFDARVQSTNLGFAPKPADGPERLFNPLALLTFTSPTTPLQLTEWLDHRFVPLCQQSADFVAFDGAPLGTDSNTVQEVIEELWHQRGGGCCDVTLEPNSDDLSQRVKQILDTTKGDIKICLRRGIYPMVHGIRVQERTVTLVGCPSATILVSEGFEVRSGGHLKLNHLTMVSAHDQLRSLVSLDNKAIGLSAEKTNFLMPAPTDLQAAILAGDWSPKTFDPANPWGLAGITTDSRVFVKLHACTTVAGWTIAGRSLALLNTVECRHFNSAGCVQLGKVRELRISNCQNTAGLDLSSTHSWTVEFLSMQPEKWLSQLPGLSVQRNAVALYAGMILSGSVQQCTVQASHAVACVAVQQVDWSNNKYACKDGAIILQYAHSCSFVMETYEVSAGPAMWIAKQAVDVMISHCHIHTGELGIILDNRSTQLADALTLEHVTIEANTIRAKVGISIGSDQAYLSDSADLHLRDNQITADETCIYGWLSVQNGRPAHLDVSGNQLDGPRCIEISRFICSVRGNTLSFGDSDSHFGITLSETGSASVEQNRLWCPLGASTGIVLHSGGSMSVRSNYVECEYSLVAVKIAVLTVDSNELKGRCEIQSIVDKLTWNQNKATHVQIVDANSGHISGSWFGKQLQVAGAFGNWQVIDNYAEDAITILPATRTNEFLSPWIVDLVRARRFNPLLEHIESLAQNNSQTLIVGQVDWVASWNDAIRASVREHFDEPFKVVSQDLINRAQQIFERAWQIQATANRCHLLQIGFAPTNDDVDPTPLDSLAIVTANRAVKAIIIQNYRNSIVAHNASSAFSSWINNSPSSIPTPNLNR